MRTSTFLLFSRNAFCSADPASEAAFSAKSDEDIPTSVQTSELIRAGSLEVRIAHQSFLDEPEELQQEPSI
jgi:hypothetical protein